ncbi:hypothetical protein CTAYLR_008881 [Chrysophaeum taylorii]|uniref:G-patch domain-containing protein n=1 Tax=Chrysophaeum taylorii TaxID=2483200 RepID=A0AAD7U868_9STRA|nr:hypothetical protein CTAYLR_008881 [Chrysophaeum taylorii]
MRKRPHAVFSVAQREDTTSSSSFKPRKLYIPGDDDDDDDDAKHAPKEAEDYLALDVAALEGERKRRFGERPPPGDDRVLSSAERMRTALERPLGAENKGFQMLKAMGYEEGQGVGKRRGIPTPIDADLLAPRQRAGIGVLEAKHRAHAAISAAKAQAARAQGQTFRVATRSAAVERAAARAARRARHAVCDLDERAGISPHDLWPRNYATAKHITQAFVDAQDEVYARTLPTATDDPPETDGGFDSEPPLVQLRAALAYLRDVHCYCLSLGARLDDDSGAGPHLSIDDDMRTLLDDAAE